MFLLASAVIVVWSVYSSTKMRSSAAGKSEPAYWPFAGPLLHHCESISVHACRKIPLLTFAGYVVNDDIGLLYNDSPEQEE
jgi:hypothetical protein